MPSILLFQHGSAIGYQNHCGRASYNEGVQALDLHPKNSRAEIAFNPADSTGNRDWAVFDAMISCCPRTSATN
jgi:hypothetical protein